MTYYSREGGRGFFPNPRQQFGYPPMSPQQFGYPTPNSFPQPNNYYPSNQGNSFGIEPWQQQQLPFNPYQQLPNQGYGGLPGNLSRIMGHVGTLSNGINMMRSVGTLMSLFRI